MDKILLLAGCAIFVAMGAMHLYYLLYTDKFLPRDEKLMADMQRVSPNLTRRTTMWKAWIGFNASHSLGAILFGALYIVVALENYNYLRGSIALNVILLAVPVSFLFLAIKFWFRAPRNGIIAGSILIVLSMLIRTMV